MLDTDKLVDRLHYDGTREYTRKDGNVVYLDGSRLGRPADMPKPQIIVMGIIVVIGIVIGLVILNDTVISSLRTAATMEQTVQENLQRESSLSTTPKMTTLINLDDAAIKANFEQAGYTIYDASSLNDNGNMTLYKLPSDMTVEEASLMYLRGISALNAADATRLLNGSWYFGVDRINTTSMIVRYADFTTGDPQVAVQNALAHEEFSSATVTESGIDESNNTFTMGTLDADGIPCTWKISALPLDEMYSVNGLPENACYVGIRLTK